MKRFLTIAALVLTCAFTAGADEGMWMVNAINKALEKNMRARGLKLRAGEIYNADAPGSSLCDAVVSLDFGCTGSLISDQGLLITNHHCAFADVHSLSSSECNYLEDGFWAFEASEERHIPGKKAFFLQKVIDVTEEAQGLKAEFAAEGKDLGIRKLSYIIEKKYNQENPGLEASLSSMWAGEKYYLALYKVYEDLRLVAAPPVGIAAYGGDTDNWEWPQHKCDFALYRIYCSPTGEPAGYSEDNVPLESPAKLTISTRGYKEGDFNMVIGYPGRTDRFSSSYKLGFNKDMGLPVSNLVRGEQMRIARRWMDSNPKTRLKYQDWYFSLSNVQELNVGQVQCWNRFGVLQERRQREAELQEWIDADPARQARWGSLLKDLEECYGAVSELQKYRIWFRETLVRGCRMSLIVSRLSNAARSKKPGREAGKGHWKEMFEELDLGLEKELFCCSAQMFLENVPREYWSEYQREIVGDRKDYAAIAEEVWEGSRLSKGWCTDLCRENGNCTGEGRGRHWKKDLLNDPLVRFLQEVKITDFNEAINAAEKGHSALELEHEFTKALYGMYRDKGLALYPDANSTMRLTYGRVGGLNPRDAVKNGWQSHARGILEKENPEDYDFRLKDDFKAFLSKLEADYPVNFLNDCDITGGNSGSPVLNSKGELIGLAFDGNKESLASDASYTPSYNKCVCVDIRYILAVLSSYAHLDRILYELE